MAVKYGVTEVFIAHDYYAALRIKLLKKNGEKFILLENQGDYLKEICEITTDKKIYTAKKGFLPIDLDFELLYIYEDGDYSLPRYKYILHEGSSRSSKSWSIEEWAIRQCEEKSMFRINVWRETKTSLADSVWKDFRKIFPLSGRSYQFPQNTIAIYFPNGSTIEPHGADTDNAHGITQDVAWLNEPYGIKKETFDQIDQRCNQMIIDINPKQKHWSDDIAKHPRCKVIHSTFERNPFCPPEQKLKILSYNPNNPINVINGTAGEYMWQVYGLGLRADKPNKIYKGWQKTTRQHYESLDLQKYYGLDFGHTHPTACVEIKYAGDLVFYIKQIFYKPMRLCESPLGANLISNGVPVGNSTYIWADSSDRQYQTGISQINDLRTFYNLNVYPVKKPSYEERFNFITKCTIIFTEDSTDFENEYDNYEFQLINGINTEKPIKIDDDLMNAMEYGIWSIKDLLGLKV